MAPSLYGSELPESYLARGISSRWIRYYICCGSYRWTYRARALRALRVHVTFSNRHVVAAAEGRHI